MSGFREAEGRSHQAKGPAPVQRRRQPVTVVVEDPVPLDPDHRRQALLYLAELLAPLFGADSSA